MTFPVVLKTSTRVEARARIFYVVAANGVFQVRELAAYRAVTRVAGPIPGLVPECEHLHIRFPRLPRADVEDVLAFFEEVYRRHRGEAMAVLFYRAESREFRIGVPPQTLCGRRRANGRWETERAVRYADVAVPQGFCRFGDVHSHADLPAYASAQDCADERYEDGLHIIFGSFDEPTLTVAASFVSNGVRFRLEPSDVLEPHERRARPARAEWLACVTREDAAGRCLQDPMPCRERGSGGRAGETS